MFRRESYHESLSFFDFSAFIILDFILVVVGAHLHACEFLSIHFNDSVNSAKESLVVYVTITHPSASNDKLSGVKYGDHLSVLTQMLIDEF